MALSLTGCADKVAYDVAGRYETVGFWYGLWHGLILPISFFFSVLSDNYSIYAIYNNGVWYDFGFWLGVGTLGGGGSAAR